MGVVQGLNLCSHIQPPFGRLRWDFGPVWEPNYALGLSLPSGASDGTWVQCGSSYLCPCLEPPIRSLGWILGALQGLYLCPHNEPPMID